MTRWQVWNGAYEHDVTSDRAPILHLNHFVRQN